MDTFSVRNKNKNIDIFELDHPLTQKYKLKRLQNTGFDIPDNVYFVPIDFKIENINDVLYASGFDFKKPTFLSFLGVTYYLNKSDFENTIRSIANTTSGQTEIVIDFPDKEIFGTKRAKYLADITASVGEPMQEGLELTEIKNILAKYGFSVENHMSPKDIQGEYLKNNENLKAYENVHFITALKEI